MRIRRLVPTKLDLYVLMEVIGPCLGGILFFCFVFLMFQALRLADFFIRQGVPGLILLKMIGLMVLSFMPTALPIAFLIGILIAFGRLSADSELVALKAHGIGPMRMAMPVLLIGVVVSVLTLALNLTWVPWGDREFKSTLIKVSNTKVAAGIREGTFTSGFFDLLIFADKYDQKTNRLHRVFIYDEREAKNPMVVIAREGEIMPVKSGTELGTSAVLRLFRGSIHRNDSENGSYQKIDYGQYRLFLKIDEGNDTSFVKPRMVPYSGIMKIIRDNPKGSWPHREFTTELWRRYGMAITPLLFVFLGIGYGTVRTRAVRASAALIALLVIVLYWALQAGCTILAHKGYADPVLAMQIPNLAVLVLAIHGFRSAAW